MKRIDTRKNIKIRSWDEFVNSVTPKLGSLRSKYIEARNEENMTNTSAIPKIYLYSGIFFI
jgi:hypothetical protein